VFVCKRIDTQCIFHKARIRRWRQLLYRGGIHSRRIAMAKPNYQYEKRQRELEKKKAKAEKALKKTQAAEEPELPADASTTPATSTADSAE
jgi:hypothetical protein